MDVFLELKEEKKLPFNFEVKYIVLESFIYLEENGASFTFHLAAAC